MSTKVKGDAIKEGSIPLSALNIAPLSYGIAVNEIEYKDGSDTDPVISIGEKSSEQIVEELKNFLAECIIREQLGIIYASDDYVTYQIHTIFPGVYFKYKYGSNKFDIIQKIDFFNIFAGQNDIYMHIEYNEEGLFIQCVI